MLSGCQKNNKKSVGGETTVNQFGNTLFTSLDYPCDVSLTGSGEVLIFQDVTCSNKDSYTFQCDTEKTNLECTTDSYGKFLKIRFADRNSFSLDICSLEDFKSCYSYSFQRQ